MSGHDVVYKIFYHNCDAFYIGQKTTGNQNQKNIILILKKRMDSLL